jgi:Rad3-related DNA helicase|tara:strand:+ start:1187 stop:2821 length:1635 start_codon:yes stop_codon:yes gene_type:complete
VISNLLNNFPEGYTPNSQQVKLLKNIDQAFDDGYKFVVCNAPTGSGKSFVSKTVGNVSRESSKEFHDVVTSYLAFKHSQGGSYAHEDECNEEVPFGCTALTITKTLQDQYKDLFNDIEVLKGKSNYQCDLDNRFSVDLAPCLHLPRLKDECWAKNSCPYYEQRNKALVSKFNTLNYSMFFSLPEHLKKRQFIICDEASELEDQLVKEFTCKIDYGFLRNADIDYVPYVSTRSGERWLNTLAVDVEEKIDELKEILSNKKDTSNKRILIDLKSEIIKLRNLHGKLTLIINSWSEAEYVFEKDKEGVTFMPLKVDRLSYRLFDYADKVILMSATIIDPVNFCKTLGVKRFKYVEAESNFSAKKAPIVCNSKYKLNYYNMQKNLPHVIKIVKQICEHHKDDKGIIHTHNNVITSALSKQLYGDRFLYREPGVRNEDILEQHYASEDSTVLISPSMSYGVDLRDDLARFQIIMKAPFLPTKDTRIARLMKDDFDWYQNKMLCSLIQSCGRGVRSSKDYCITYILDATIVESVLKSKHKLPAYFLDRFN